MSKKKKNRKHRKAIIVVEAIVLAVLTVVLVASIWLTHKLSLVNYTELDSSRLITASQANKTTSTPTPTPTEAVDTTDTVSVTETPTPEPTEEVTEDTGLSGIDMIALVGLDSRSFDGDYATHNSDTMIICCINHNDKTIKLVSVYRDTYLNVGDSYYGEPNYYTKANEAYNYGGPEQFLTMLNLNLDLDITQFMTVEFKALADCIELMGGIDIELTREEVDHLNNYNIETSEACGYDYVELEMPSEDEFYGAMTMSFHLNGTQAVSYARIRYTSGNDFRRASRQRQLLTLVKEKAQTLDVFTLNSILDAVLPQVTTNMDSAKIMSMFIPILSYSMSEDTQTGFPSVHLEDDGSITGIDCVMPVTLEYNVAILHNFLFPDEEYYPSETVQEYSYQISCDTNCWDEDIELALTNTDNAEIPHWSAEQQAEWEAYKAENGIVE